MKRGIVRTCVQCGKHAAELRVTLSSIEGEVYDTCELCRACWDDNAEPLGLHAPALKGGAR